MKYFVIIVALFGISSGVSGQKLSALEKLKQLEQTRHFPYCDKLNLSQNFPNPVKQGQRTMINYKAIDASVVEIVIYNSLGKMVSITSVAPGVGEFEIHSGQLVAGEYYYALVVNGRRISIRKMIITAS